MQKGVKRSLKTVAKCEISKKKRSAVKQTREEEIENMEHWKHVGVLFW